MAQIVIQLVLPNAVTTVQPLQGNSQLAAPPLFVGLLATYFLVVQIQAHVLNFDICYIALVAD